MGNVFCPLADKVLTELSDVSGQFVRESHFYTIHCTKAKRKSLMFECINQNIYLYVSVMTKWEEK